MCLGMLGVDLSSTRVSRTTIVHGKTFVDGRGKDIERLRM